MRIRVRSLTGQTELIEISSILATVDELKHQVEISLGIPTDLQRLIFQGKELSDEHASLDSYQVTDNCILHLVVRQKAEVPLAPPAGVLPDIEMQNYQAQHNQYHRYGNAGEFSGEHIYNAFRLSRIIMMFALIDTFFLFLYAIYLYPLFLAIFFPLSAYYGAKQLKHNLLLPYMFYLVVMIGVRIYVIAVADNSSTKVFSVLSIFVELYILKLCVTFFQTVKALSEEERLQMLVFNMIH